MSTCSDGHPLYEVYVDFRKLIGFCTKMPHEATDDCFGHEKSFPSTWHQRCNGVTRL